MPAALQAKLFELHRDDDETGVSGTGVVAEGVEFTSGMVAMTWISPHRCINIYESIKTVEALHGHEGRTRVVWTKAKAEKKRGPGRLPGDHE